MSDDSKVCSLPVTITNADGTPEQTIRISGAPASPVTALDARNSILFPLEDSPGKPTDELIEFSLKAAHGAMKIDLSEISSRIADCHLKTPDTWPGQHYKLLASMVQLIQPKLIIEIGTASGYSCLSLKKFLPEHGKVVTFDIVPWKQYPDVILQESDFADGRLKQQIADLTQPHVFNSFSKLIGEADFMFVDAAKDGVMEQTFLNFFETVRFQKPLFIFFDDIRLWNMLAIWRNIQRPKLDITSFGSWCGSGLIHWIP
ncbi:MAG: methyltransferase [Verrucomicrobiota bacterium]